MRVIKERNGKRGERNREIDRNFYVIRSISCIGTKSSCRNAASRSASSVYLCYLTTHTHTQIKKLNVMADRPRIVAKNESDPSFKAWPLPLARV